MMTKEGNTKIVNFMTPEAGVLALGCGHILNMDYLYQLYNTLISIVLRG